MNVKVKKGRSLNVKITDFSADLDTPPGMLHLKKPCLCYNLEGKNGGLKGGGGFVPMLETEGQTAAVCYFRKGDRATGKRADKLAAAIDGEIYYTELYGEKTLNKLETARLGSSPVSFINYRLDDEDTLIFCAKDYPMTIWDGASNVEVIGDAPNLSSACLHSERLFATDGTNGDRLWFSDDLDPRNWSVSLDEAGYIELPGLKGSLHKVISFADYVYIFRSYGITRLSAYGDQTQFSVSELFTASGRIYPESVQLCGDAVLFLADDGLYRFDGFSATPLKLGIDSLLIRCDKSRLCSGTVGGQYFLSFACEFPAPAIGCEAREFFNNAVLKMDLSDRRVTLFRGVDIVSMTAALTDEEGYLAAAERRDGKIRIVRFREDAPSPPGRVSFAETDFGDADGIKLFKKLHLVCDGPFLLRLRYDGRILEKTCGEGGSIPVFIAAKRFGFDIEPLGASPNISELRLEAELL